MRRSQTSTVNYFCTFIFLYRKIYILLENIFEKTAVMKHQRSYRYKLVRRRRFSTQNTQILKYLNTLILVAMDYFFFCKIFQRSKYNSEKNKSICETKYFIHAVQVTGFFRLCMPQIFVHYLEKNQKNSVCIDVNFSNL